jgi:hypothetical protein
MSQLNIQDKKLNIIEQLIMLNDDDVLNQLEEIINTSLNRPPLKKISKQDLKERAELSNNDIINGDLYSQDEVEKISQNW